MGHQLLFRAALSADLVEPRLLFVAERGVKVDDHGTDVLDRFKHRVDPPGDRTEVGRKACRSQPERKTLERLQVHSHTPVKSHERLTVNLHKRSSLLVGSKLINGR